MNQTKRNGVSANWRGGRRRCEEREKERESKKIQFSNLILLTRQLMFYQQKHERITQICVRRSTYPV